MERDIQAAARAVVWAMAEMTWNQSDLAREAGIDPGTLGDFLAGRRWPQAKSRSKIEQALHLNPGMLHNIAHMPGPGSFKSLPDETTDPDTEEPESPDLPVGDGVDPELLAQLSEANPTTIEAVRAVLKAAQRED